MFRLKSKLSFSFITVLLLTILLISGLSNYFMDQHFREYVRQNQEKSNQEIVNQLKNQYQNGTWNQEQIETIGMNALGNGMIVRVKDQNGNVLWDAAMHNQGMCQKIIEKMAENVESRYPNADSTYSEIPYSIYQTQNKVGLVEIGSYGSYYLNDHDLTFINTLNQVLIGVGVISLIVAIFIAHIIARHLSAPISRVIKSAKAIERGCYTDRIINKSKTTEIMELTLTINNLAETLENQEGLRKRLTQDVAHELRTPLATLQSHIEAMIDGIWKADNERLESCHDEIVRISKMVGNLEKIAKYESDNLILNKESFDVTELIRRLLQNFEMDYLSKQIQVEIIGENEIINADKDKISQVIVNLMSNALKYTKTGGEVKISVIGQEKNTGIIIQDNGTGIAKEDIPFVFERFYRSDKSRNSLTGGSGIGLTITKAIVEAHNGTIEVKSESDYGTIFTVWLPKKIEK